MADLDDPVTVWVHVEGEPVEGAYVMVEGSSAEPLLTDADGRAQVFLEGSDRVTVAAIVGSPVFDGVQVLAAVTVDAVEAGEELHIGRATTPEARDVPAGESLRASVGMPTPHPDAAYYEYEFGCGVSGITNDTTGVIDPIEVDVPPRCLVEGDVRGVLLALDGERTPVARTHVMGRAAELQFEAWAALRTFLDVSWTPPRPWWEAELRAGPAHPGGRVAPIVLRFDDRDAPAATIDVGPEGFSSGYWVHWSEQDRRGDFGARERFVAGDADRVELLEADLPPGVTATYDAASRTYDVRLLGERREGVLLYASAAWFELGFTWTVVAPAKVGPLTLPELDPALAEPLGLLSLGEPDVQLVEAFVHAEYPTNAAMRQELTGRWSGFEPVPTTAEGEGYDVGWSRFELVSLDE